MNKLKRLITLCVMACVMVMMSSCSVVDPMLAKVNDILHDVLKKHQYVTEWTNDETNHWNSCKTKGCKEVINKAAHTYDDGKVTTPATEETEGVMTYVCTVCGYEKTEKIDKLAHSHNLTKVNEVEATCTASGTKAYYTCSGCDSIFSDAEGKNEISKPETIKKLDHVDDDKDHACDVCGTVMGTHEAAEGKHTCDYCGEKVSDCADEDKDHACDVCGTAMGTHEAAEGKHTCDYCGEKVSDCADEDKDHACDVCGKVLSTCEENYDEGKVTTSATCTEKGVKTYTCQVCGGTKTEDVPATGHTDENGDYECDDCHVTLCVKHEEGEEVKENEKAATCKAEGSYDLVVYCVKCHETISRTSVTVDKLAHTPAEAVKENEVVATCKAEGSYDSVVYCSVCKEEISREKKTIAKKAHTEVVDSAVAPTCTETGLTEGKHCSVCNEVIVAQKIVDTIDHTPSAPVEENMIDSTCSTEGSYNSVVYCSVCNEKLSSETKTIPTKSHDYETEVTAPTCTEAGYTTYTCTACGDTYKEEGTPALGHTLAGEWTLGVAPTYEAEGSLTKNCSVCSQDVAEVLPVISEENGYTKVIDGVLTRWQYTYNDFTFTVDLENTDATTNTYSYGVEAWYVGFDADGNRIMEPGYKHSNANWDGNFLCFGGMGCSYITTIIAPKDTTVTLILKAARNKAKPFFSDGVEWVLEYLHVNDSADGIIADTSSMLNSTGWGDFKECAVATLFLKEGKNTIAFRTANSTNFAGIGFVSTEELHMHTDVYTAPIASTCISNGFTYGISCSSCEEVIVAQETIIANGTHTFETYSMITIPDYTSEGKLVKKCTLCGVADEESVVVLSKVSEENGYTKVSSTDTEEKWQYTYAEQTFDIVIATTFDFIAFVNDPFIAANGGSISGTVSVTNDVPRYQKTQGQTFTATITVSSDTVANFIIKVENGSKTNTYKGLFSSITLDGAAVTINDGSVTGKGWGNSIDIVVASLNLTKGTHVITFTRTSSTASTNNFNIWGIGFVTSDSVSITLGSAE